MKVLQVGIELPLDLVVQKNAVLGTSGAGKSNGARAMAEEMQAHGVPWVAIDPKGDWYGIRSSGDGKGPGLDVLIIGGDHGDLPLSPDIGATLGELVAKRLFRGVIDISAFVKQRDKSRFMAEFGQALLQHASEPLHVFCDECHMYMPQNVTSSAAQDCVDVWMLVATQGRQKGIGFTLLSQRPALVSKTCLYMCESLFAMRITGERDRDAIKGWTPGPAKELVGTLHELEDGEAWLWSPQRLKRTERFRFRRSHTFDSGRTPKVGENLIAPQLAKVDIEALREALAAPPQDARDVLRGLDLSTEALAELERLRREVPQLRRDLESAIQDRSDLLAFLKTSFDCSAVLAHHAQSIITRLGIQLEAPSSPGAVPGRVVVDGPPPAIVLHSQLSPGKQASRRQPAEVARQKAEPISPKPAQKSRDQGADSPTPSGLKKCDRLILAAIVQHERLTLAQAATIVGYASGGGGVRNAGTTLRAKGFVEGGNATGLTPTAAGKAEVPKAKPLRRGAELLAYWTTKLKKCDREVLSVIVAAYPKAVSLAEAASACGYEPAGGGVRNAGTMLRHLDLVTGSNAGMTANEVLIR